MHEPGVRLETHPVGSVAADADGTRPSPQALIGCKEDNAMTLESLVLVCQLHATAGPQTGEIGLPENNGVASKSSKLVLDSTLATPRNMSCDENIIVVHVLFYPVQRPLDQAVPCKAEQQNRQVKCSGGLNRGHSERSGKLTSAPRDRGGVSESRTGRAYRQCESERALSVCRSLDRQVERRAPWSTILPWSPHSAVKSRPGVRKGPWFGQLWTSNSGHTVQTPILGL
ncbi:hypothetical protein BGY98DRAFT_933192 [Russula aff. rugulosa BPL654]|nr:hypothetical protein BGY98DRAFT_933192 [Russula aff. rugulosa BPL654]